jgi:hypothetical protein
MSFLTKAVDWFFGGTSSATVVNQVDKAFYTKQERAADDAADLADARSFMDSPAGPGFINQLIDALNRSVRPVLTYWAMGCLIGWWKSPALSELTPFMQNLIYLIITFWFGGRVVMKDIPNMLASLYNLRAKIRNRIGGDNG